MAGLIVELLFDCSLFVTLRNGLKMSEYEVHWLMDFPLIIYWTRQEIIMVISQKKQTNKY